MNAPAKFDVFLCHNSEDKPEIWKIYDQLTAQGLQPWIDDEHLPPGQFWLNALGEQIDGIRSVAVFVGGSGIGPWQQQEIASFLGAFIRRRLPVIPVLLPNAPKEPKLPVFLENFTWVDFRKQRPDPMERLIWGITGTKPILIPKQDRAGAGLIQPEIPVKTSEVLQQSKTMDADDLRSEKGIDYTKLRDLLKAQQWKEADQETYRTMIRAVGRKEGNSCRVKEFRNFPCADLETIDSLWIKYSNGRFGFSVQKQIYIECSGRLDGKEPSYEIWVKFGSCVGWQRAGTWFYNYEGLGKIYISSPQGLLPWGGGVGWATVGVWGCFPSILQRLKNCSLQKS